MGLRALLRNLAKVVLVGLGGVLGALAVVWSTANTEWAILRLPAVMVPGSTIPVEYEAQVYGVVGLSFAAGVLSCFWVALAIWLRAMRRERRLARVLERLEAQVAETRGMHVKSGKTPNALPSGARQASEPHFEDFDELEQDTGVGLFSDTAQLPEGYDEPDDDDWDDEDEPDDLGVDDEPTAGEEREESERG